MKNKKLHTFFLVGLFAVIISLTQAQGGTTPHSQEAFTNSDINYDNLHKVLSVPVRSSDGSFDEYFIDPKFPFYWDFSLVSAWRVNVPQAPEDGHVVLADPLTVHLSGNESRILRLSVGESWDDCGKKEVDSNTGFILYTLPTYAYTNNFEMWQYTRDNASIISVFLEDTRLDSPLLIVPNATGTTYLEFQGDITDANSVTRHVTVHVPVNVVE
ncbi:MAG: hypothetical protein K2W97_02645 [Chthoniobacterales bacterium]|nr:hypothetical protein [Chthoniobacterales bacterium]